MMRRIVLVVLAAITVLVGTWLAVNLWPRPMEATLWTEADLPLPPEGSDEGYRALIGMKDDPVLRRVGDILDIEPLYEILEFPFAEDQVQLASFWGDVARVEPELSKVITDHAAVSAANRNLASKPFVDRDSFRLNAIEKGPWLLLNDMRKFDALEMLYESARGGGDSVYDHWLASFRMDQAWLRSARHIISRSAAVAAVKRDLSVLSLLKAFPPKGIRSVVLQSVSEFDPDRIDEKRPLIFEYLFCLGAETSVMPQALQEKSRWLRLVYNRSLFRRELNRKFRDWALQIEGRAAPAEEAQEDFRKNPFWWFFNPAGKALQGLLFIDLTDRLAAFKTEKADMRSLRAKLLAPDFFPAEPPKPPRI